eukprot:TRINITY_DN4871_c1_g1_i3.p1 TRINITY_DN4871_c1_g1~~TRINITY_DN4871_c1_g1_i3.p1  ORF type:complete len:796 (+),score=95.68 TRINITY_DN4871_c1_g1_i3:67-2454(+)
MLWVSGILRPGTPQSGASAHSSAATGPPSVSSSPGPVPPANSLTPSPVPPLPRPYFVRVVLGQAFERGLPLFDSLRERFGESCRQNVDWKMLTGLMFGTTAVRLRPRALRVYSLPATHCTSVVFVKLFQLSVPVSKCREPMLLQFGLAVVVTVEHPAVEPPHERREGADSPRTHVTAIPRPHEIPIRPEVELLYSHFMFIESQIDKMISACQGALLDSLATRQKGGVAALQTTTPYSLQQDPGICHAALTFRETMYDFLCPPRLLRPYHTHTPPGDEDYVCNAMYIENRFSEVLAELSQRLDGQHNDFFLSRLVTAVLSNHLAWVAPLLDGSDKLPPNALAQHLLHTVPPACDEGHTSFFPPEDGIAAMRQLDADGVYQSLVASLYGICGGGGEGSDSIAGTGVGAHGFCKIAVLGELDDPTTRLLLEFLSYFVRCGITVEQVDQLDVQCFTADCANADGSASAHACPHAACLPSHPQRGVPRPTADDALLVPMPTFSTKRLRFVHHSVHCWGAVSNTLRVPHSHSLIVVIQRDPSNCGSGGGSASSGESPVAQPSQRGFYWMEPSEHAGALLRQQQLQQQQQQQQLRAYDLSDEDITALCTVSPDPESPIESSEAGQQPRQVQSRPCVCVVANLRSKHCYVASLREGAPTIGKFQPQRVIRPESPAPVLRHATGGLPSPRPQLVSAVVRPPAERSDFVVKLFDDVRRMRSGKVAEWFILRYVESSLHQIYRHARATIAVVDAQRAAGAAAGRLTPEMVASMIEVPENHMPLVLSVVRSHRPDVASFLCAPPASA